MSMLPPPCGDYFPTLDALIAAANHHARQQGYAIIKSRTKKRGDQVFKANLSCARGATRKSSGQGKRNTSTIKCGCQFDANAVRKKDTPGWELTIKNGEHNHGPSSPEDLVVHRRADMTKEVREEIRKFTEAGRKPSEIHTSLRSAAEAQGRKLVVSQRDIKNAKRIIRREAIQSTSSPSTASSDNPPRDGPSEQSSRSTQDPNTLQLQLLEQRIATQEAQLREKDALLREKDAQLRIARLEAELSRRSTNGDTEYPRLDPYS
ncbi:MAG: hypothetical protein L6R40_004748 [Gallowayella cf. fulva]|nr:MAG: hypothetical protein L6R40_004748 [Xanthomendoza cf. fulva]